jgi:TolB-like protein
MKRTIAVALTAIFLFGCAGFQAPKRVGIMDFENSTGDPKYDGLSTAIPEYLTGFMANAERIYLVERQDMNRYLGARYEEDLRQLRHERWQEIGQRLAADYFIAGSVSLLENNFIVSARLFSVTTGQIVPGSADQVSCARAADLYPQVGRMARHFIYQIQHRQPAEVLE